MIYVETINLAADPLTNTQWNVKLHMPRLLLSFSSIRPSPALEV
jgi:hypothetical protein